MACASVENCSPATDSGSARRTATWAMEAADCRSSCSLRVKVAKPNMMMTGASAESANKTVSGRKMSAALATYSGLRW